MYTCASSRGVILDLVPDTSSKEFISSLKRFIARRGCPQEILSDNGGAFLAKETQVFAAERNVKWSFSLAKAPWYGGIWERLVQSAKRCLKRIIGRTTLNFIELQTVLLEIEVILNSRPLCTLYDDDLDEPLTPNHLLFGRKLAQHNIQHAEYEVNLNIGEKRARHIEMLVEHFWERWRKEYVVSLRNWKQKYKRRNDLIPNVGDVVIVFEEKVPRQNWCLGRIIEILPSRDGQIRGAKVLIGKTKTTIERPINKLYPIEFVNESEVFRKQLSDGKLDNIVEIIHDQDNSIANVINENDTIKSINVKRKRDAAVLADIKLKYMT